MGWSLPAFYDWTGSDQSSPSPLIGRFYRGLTLGGVLVCLALPLLPIKAEAEDRGGNSSTRFRIRSLLLFTAVIAVLLALSVKFPLLVSSLISATVLALAIRYVVYQPADRWSVAALLGCMYFPYVWVFGYDEFDRINGHLLRTCLGLPTLFPAAYFGRWVLGIDALRTYWLPMLMTAAELAIGIWLIWLGPRLAIAAFVFAMLMSVFSSFAFYQLCIF